MATEFEYRRRSWLIALVFILAYSFYNLDDFNVVYAIVPSNQRVLSQAVLVRLAYAGAALLAGIGTAVATWASAYRSYGGLRAQRQVRTFVVGGPYRYVRNPHYLGNFLLLIGLGSFKSRWGFPVLLIGEALLFFRLVVFEETELAQQYGGHFQEYCRCVGRLVPSLRPRVAASAELPRWRRAIVHQAFQWGCVITLIAFACTLSDPVGYALGFASLSILILQKLAEAFFTERSGENRTTKPM